MLKIHLVEWSSLLFIPLNCTFKDRLATFFENIGWKVYTVPETATILLGGRVKFEELNYDQAYLFQKDLLRTMLQIEDVSFLLKNTADVIRVLPSILAEYFSQFRVTSHLHLGYLLVRNSLFVSQGDAVVFDRTPSAAKTA